MDMRETFLHQDCQAVQQIAHSSHEVSGLEGFQDLVYKVLRNFVWPYDCFNFGRTYLRSLPG